MIAIRIGCKPEINTSVSDDLLDMSLSVPPVQKQAPTELSKDPFPPYHAYQFNRMRAGLTVQ
jgi:hypothetical protein